MMYRDWREITKSLLSKGESANLPKNKMARPETKTYVAWVKDEIKRNLSLFDGYTKGHGIIATRERFLEWLETDEGKRGKGKTETDKQAAKPPGKEFGKTIIMPIAIPGVGTSHPSSIRGVSLLRTTSRQNLNRGGSNRVISLRTHTERRCQGQKACTHIHSECQETLARP
jgi:tRNA splicing ligase